MRRILLFFRCHITVPIYPLLHRITRPTLKWKKDQVKLWNPPQFTSSNGRFTNNKKAQNPFVWRRSLLGNAPTNCLIKYLSTVIPIRSFMEFPCPPLILSIPLPDIGEPFDMDGHSINSPTMWSKWVDSDLAPHEVIFYPVYCEKIKERVHWLFFLC